MESLEPLAMDLLWASAGLTLLILVMCLAGLLWAPLGASIAVLYARYRKVSTDHIASTAAWASVHLLVSWIYVMAGISNQRRGVGLYRSFHIGALVLWLFGPILLLAQLGLYGTASLILDRLTNPESHPPENDFRFVLYLIIGAATLVIAALCALLWYRSLRQVGMEARSERQGDLWLPVHVSRSLRMTILWSVGSVVYAGIVVMTSLLIWRETTVVW